MSTTTLLLIIILILSIACLFCNTSIERVTSTGGVAIGYNTYGMSINDRRMLNDYGSKTDEVQEITMYPLRAPIKGGENPQLFDQYLDYGTSYYPHKRFPKAYIGQESVSDSDS